MSRDARRAFFVFLSVTFLFICASAFGSYKAYEYTESVSLLWGNLSQGHETGTRRLPGRRARACRLCRLSRWSGAGWYVRSKLSGAYQLYSVTFNKFPRPITTPVHNLRPAPETCEQCHWPEKFFGAQLKVFNHYAYDEKNTLRQTRMLINVGGGSPTTGGVAGIHWHMNIANKIEYVSTDDQRQVIPWVRIQGQAGNVTEYYDRTRPLNAAADCGRPASDAWIVWIVITVRPTFIFPPDMALDQAFAAGRLDPSLPFLKRAGRGGVEQTLCNRRRSRAINRVRSRSSSIDATTARFYAQKP